MQKQAAILARLQELASGAYGAAKGPAKAVLGHDPILSSIGIGAGLGAVSAGESRRLRGALAGGAAGAVGGVLGAGVVPALGSAGRSPGKQLFRQAILKAMGPSTLKHQLIGAGTGGVLAGAAIQPLPVPVLMSQSGAASEGLGGGILDRAMDKVKESVNSLSRV